MFYLKMNIWWENFVQLGLPLFIFLGLFVYAVIKVSNENKKK
jgi:hypothetical protein